MDTGRVLALLPLLVGVANCFSWDIVVAGEKRLEFYDNGTLTHAEDIPTANDITAVTYDAVDDRVLFADYHDTNTSICSFDISTSKLQPVVTRITPHLIPSLAYDPVTQLLFWKEGNYEIYSLSLKPASSNKTVDEKLIVTLDSSCLGIAMDSCGGFVYWITEKEIGRAAFDGSKREVLVDNKVFWRQSLTIDPQTQQIFWIEETMDYKILIKSADMIGKNRRTLYPLKLDDYADSLTVSKDFIYWRSYVQKVLWKLPKTKQRVVGPIFYSEFSRDCASCGLTAAKYTIKEQTLGIQGCEALKNFSSDPSSMDVELTKDHATEASVECYGTACHNYCVHGSCSVGAEGQPKCSCYNGYSGLRCEVNACHQYCLNDGVCSLNEDSEPVCQCTGDYESDRCDVPAFITKLFLYAYKNIPPATLCERVKTCAATVV